MKLQFQEYQFWKIKNYLKKNKLFFFFNSSRIKSSSWLNADQIIKKFQWNYYTVHNNSILNIIIPSIYKNNHQIICSIILLIKQNFQKTYFILQNIDYLKPFFEPLTLKLNNKIYSIVQIKNLKPFHFIKTIETLKKVLILNIRISIKSK
jgi:hypothetical protein